MSKFVNDRSEALLIYLRMNMDTFSKKEKLLAEHTLNNHCDVSNTTIANLASILDISPGLIVRFCKNLGFRGFADFKNALGTIPEEALEEQAVIGDFSMEETIGRVFNNAALTLEDTLKINKLNDIAKVARWIIEADRVQFFANGGSARIAENANRKFVRWKPTISFHRDSHQQLRSAQTLTEGCVAVGISYSGKTDNVIKCLEYAKQNGAKTLAITSSKGSKLARIADQALYSAIRGEDQFNENEFTKLAQIVLLDSIYFCFVNELEKVQSQLKS